QDNAEWILAKFKSFGLDAHIETFDVLFPTPIDRVVELVAPTRFVAKLQEPVIPGDSTSAQQREQLPSYNAYSIDGDVTAPLVYVNFGVPADYEELDRLGITVKGAIVIARYGGSWRGIKPKVAAEHGAVGCLIYSDPRDDGYQEGETFPNGPFRPRDGAQDPASGMAPVMEEMRALGTLLKQGWKPKRTIVYCAWDGEEPGLLGSTEWAEAHAEELRQKGAVYLNSDSNGRGILEVQGSHTLEKFVNGVARDIEDPETKGSVWKRLQAFRIARAE